MTDTHVFFKYIRAHRGIDNSRFLIFERDPNAERRYGVNEAVAEFLREAIVNTVEVGQDATWWVRKA